MTETTRRPRELEAIELLTRLVGPPVGDEVWIGDDAAVLDPLTGRVLFATDLAAEGVHFDRRQGTLADVGWRVLVQNLSDIAAMGGRPRAAVVAVAGAELDELERIYEGLLEASRRFECPVVGGDLSDAAVLNLSVAILGETAGVAPVLRSGAKPGETIYVTNPLGAAAAGLRELRADPSASSPCVQVFLRPEPRLAEGAAAAVAGATAMIDVSDGFGIDLRRLADASDVGVALDELPVAPGASRGEALGGGEDYELIFTVPDPGRVAAVFAAHGLNPPLRVGSTTADPSAFHLGGVKLDPAGYEHRLG
ncbi:MAG: thiamine-phosphate kinase [Acidimicrobiales bacterium]